MAERAYDVYANQQMMDDNEYMEEDVMEVISSDENMDDDIEYAKHGCNQQSGGDYFEGENVSLGERKNATTDDVASIEKEDSDDSDGETTEEGESDDEVTEDEDETSEQQLPAEHGATNQEPAEIDDETKQESADSETDEGEDEASEDEQESERVQVQEKSEDENETKQDGEGNHVREEAMEIDGGESPPVEEPRPPCSLSLSSAGCGCLEALSCSELDMMYRLAGNDSSVRARTLEILKHWLSKVIRRCPDIPECREAVEGNFIRLWKALLHGMWSAAEEKDQNELLESISSLHDTIAVKLHPYLIFVEMFVRLMAREWSWRSTGMNEKVKFKKLFRHCIRKTFAVLCSMDSSKDVFKGFSSLVSNFIFNRFHDVPKSSERILLTPVDFQIDFSSAFIKVVARGGLNRDKLYTMLNPFLNELQERTHRSLTEKIRKRIIQTNVLPQHVGPFDVHQISVRIDLICTYKRLRTMSKIRGVNPVFKASVIRLKSKVWDLIVEAKRHPKTCVLTPMQTPHKANSCQICISQSEEYCKAELQKRDLSNQAEDAIIRRQSMIWMQRDELLSNLVGCYDNYIQFEMAQLDVEFAQVCDYIQSVKMQKPVPNPSNMKRKYKANDEPEGRGGREIAEENSNMEDTQDTFVNKKPKMDEINEQTDVGSQYQNNAELQNISPMETANQLEIVPPKNKGVHIVLARNTSHEYSDYMYRLKTFTDIPYDKNRIPLTRGLLKTKEQSEERDRATARKWTSLDLEPMPIIQRAPRSRMRMSTGHIPTPVPKFPYDN